MKSVKMSSFRIGGIFLFLLAMQSYPFPSQAEDEQGLTVVQNDIGCKICQDSCSNDDAKCQQPCESSNKQCQAKCGTNNACQVECAKVYKKCIGQCINQRNACWKGCPCRNPKAA